MGLGNVLQTFSFWQFKMQNSTIDDILFSSYNKGYTQSSKFVYFAYVDTHKDIFRCGWSMHEDQSALNGYLTHIIVPCIYLNWLEDKIDDFYLPMSEFDIVEKEVKYIKDMEHEAQQILDYKDKILATTRYDFELNSKEKEVTVKVFDSMSNVIDTLNQLIPFDEVFEETFEMGRSEFKARMLSLENEPFLKNRIVAYLNQHCRIIF